MNREIDWASYPPVTIYYGEGNNSIESQVIHPSHPGKKLILRESSYELLGTTQYSSELYDGERETVVSLDNSAAHLSMTSVFDQKNPRQHGIMIIEDSEDEVKCAFGIKEGTDENTSIRMDIELHMNQSGLFLISANNTTYGDFYFTDMSEELTDDVVSIVGERGESFHLGNRVIVLKPEGKKLAILCQSTHEDMSFYYTINLPFFTPAMLYQSFRSLKLNPLRIREVLEHLGLQVQCTIIPPQGKVKTSKVI